jgi:hypothetical protein
MPSHDHYQAKASGCRQWATKALTPRERNDWLKLAAQWEALAMAANPSDHLPWKVEAAPADAR